METKRVARRPRLLVVCGTGRGRARFKEAFASLPYEFLAVSPEADPEPLVRGFDPDFIVAELRVGLAGPFSAFRGPRGCITAVHPDTLENMALGADPAGRILALLPEQYRPRFLADRTAVV